MCTVTHLVGVGAGETVCGVFNAVVIIGEDR